MKTLSIIFAASLVILGSHARAADDRWIFVGQHHDGSWYEWPNIVTGEQCQAMRSQPADDIGHIWCVSATQVIPPATMPDRSGIDTAMKKLR